MKKNIFFSLTIIALNTTYSQNPLPIKERFDWLLYETSANESDGIYEKNLYYDPSKFCYSMGNAGEGMPYIINAWLKLYKVTGDKGYLIKAMNEFITLHNARNDKRSCGIGENTLPIWSSLKSGQCFYFNGYILTPMTKFLYMVIKEEPSLLNFQIPSGLGDISNYATIGDFATTLWNWVVETYNCIQVNWDGINTKCYNELKDDEYVMLIINMQSQFALASYYFYYATDDEYYLDIFKKLAFRYKYDYRVYTSCYDWYAEDVFFWDSNTNSYMWRDQAWCDVYINESCNHRFYGWEDMSHANSVLEFPKESSLGDAPSRVFEQSDIVRWHNTFTKKLWKGSSYPYSFNNNVTGGNLYYGHNDLPYSDPNHFQVVAMNYMPFEEVDEIAGNESVYDIVMNLYSNQIFEKENNFNFLGQQMSGLADVVTAQWKRECPNLTIKNRGLVYSQNFFSKNDLTIDPICAENAVFEPRIPNYNNVFIIEPNVTSTIIAGNSITFKAGFHAKNGSNVHAFIDPTICTVGSQNTAYNHKNVQQTSNYQNDNTSITLNNNKINDNKVIFKPELRIYPNPFNSRTNINYTISANGNVKLTIYNSMNIKVAELVNESQQEGQHQVIFDGTNLSGGIYYCIFEAENYRKVEKIVLVK